MKNLISLLIIVLAFRSEAQVVSRFTFDASPLTTANIGPNGTSISGTAVAATVAAPINHAVNPGTPKTDINLTVPGSPYFDLPGIDIDVYFKKEESEASFFKRGSVFDFGVSGNQLYVKFSTNAGSNPGTIPVASGSVYALPGDHAFHHYRFRYDNNTGTANLYVDDVIVYTYTGTAGYTLNWTNAGNVVIGSLMDATGTNVPVLGAITVQNPMSAATLPVSFLSFTAALKNNGTMLDWTTTKESNIARYSVESSVDGNHFTAIGQVLPATSYSPVHHYRFADSRTVSNTVFYRINTVDADGKSTYSEIRKINVNGALEARCYPNPATDYVTLSLSGASTGSYSYAITTINGNIVEGARVNVASGTQQIRISLSRSIAPGILMIRLVNDQDHSSFSFKIVKG